MAEVVATQWGEGLIRSWNTHDWIDLPGPGRRPHRAADRRGAGHGRLVADSTSVNLFEVLVAALRLRPGRKVILSGATTSRPTPISPAGVAELLGQGHELRLVEARRDRWRRSATRSRC